MKIRNLVFFALAFFGLFITACDKDEPTPEPEPMGPEITQLQVTPNSDVTYGDDLQLTGSLSHETGLASYTIQVKKGSDLLFEKIQLLTGKTYTLDETITLPLPRNAEPGNLEISLTAKDVTENISTKEVTVTNVSVPQFEELYIVLNSNKVYTLSKEGDLFTVEDFIPANAAGKIYVNADKSGLNWGMKEGEIAPLGKDDIVFGGEEETYTEITFNPVTFELSIGGGKTWTPIDEALYILGGISGHWADGEITMERSKMKMQGYESGEEKFWVWVPPNDGTGDPETDMWGAIVAGSFRFKVAGEEQYLTYANNELTLGSDDPSSSFEISTGGAFTIKVFKDASGYTKVSLEDDSRSLEYTNDGILINGVLAPSAITFAGKDLDLIEGTYFTYEGRVDLKTDDKVSASGVDLSNAFADPDVFSGGGNANWEVVGPDGEYLVRIDPFSGNVYVCKMEGYPEVIYMDGWAFGRTPLFAKPDWDERYRMCLYRNDDGFTYSGTAYVLPWGGDASLWAAPYTEDDAGSRIISSKYFEGVTRAEHGFLLPVPAAPGQFYDVTVDLKDGFSYDTDNTEDGYYVLIPKNDKKFTITFTPQ